jgi:hypothetical protein
MFLLLVVLIFIGCNQSDSNGKPPSASEDDSDNKQSQTATNDNTAYDESEPEVRGKVLARVNGQPIYEDDLKGYNLEYVVTEEIIYQEGIRQGIDKQYRDQVRNYNRRLIIRGSKQNILENAAPTKTVSDEEIKNFYENNKDKYSHVRIHEISFPDSRLGSEIQEKAKNGEELQTIANSHPDLEITVNDIGYNRAMAQHFKTREVGMVSEVIQKPDGTFSVLKIVEIKDIPFNISKKSIKFILEAFRKTHMYDSYARKVAEENNMTIEIIQQDSEQ